MRNAAVILSIVTAMAVLAPMSTAQAGGTAPFERLVVADTDDDFLLNEAMDIMALHVSERFRFDFDRQQGIGDAFLFRIQIADIQAFPDNVQVRYHVFADANGSAQDFWVEVANGQAGPEVTATASGVGGGLNGTGVIVSVPYDLVGATVGSQLTNVWAATSTAGGEQRVFQDKAPHDNAGLPAGNDASAPSGTGAVVAQGPFPFVTLQPEGPLDKMSAEGDPVTFRFQVVPSVALSGEIVRFYFDVPAGWEAEPSRGNGGVGELTNVGSSPIGFAVTVSAKGVPLVNDTAQVLMEMVSTSGAHAIVPLNVVVTGPKLDSDAYAFELVSGTSYDAGKTSQLQFQVAPTNATGVDAGMRVKVDFFLQGELVDTVDAQDDNGTYVAEYSFPSEGKWVADVYLANMRPSPHQEFEVDVGGGGLLPAPGLPFLLVAAALGAVILHRRR